MVDPPGGKQSINIVGGEYEEVDALSLAPPRDGGDGVDVDLERLEKVHLHVEPEAEGTAKIEEEKGGETEESKTSNPPPGFRPTRKVREGELSGDSERAYADDRPRRQVFHR